MIIMHSCRGLLRDCENLWIACSSRFISYLNGVTADAGSAPDDLVGLGDQRLLLGAAAAAVVPVVVLLLRRGGGVGGQHAVAQGPVADGAVAVNKGSSESILIPQPLATDLVATQSPDMSGVSTMRSTASLSRHTSVCRSPCLEEGWL